MKNQLRRMFNVLAVSVAAVVAVSSVSVAQDDRTATRRRPRITPVNNAATATQAVNETRDDTARINAATRARSSHYHRDDGAIVWVDTLTGDEWIDSAAIRSLPRMKYPLLSGISVGVNVWDPLMRAFGQKYGLIGFTADVALHNRYFPAFEVGLGQASDTPSGMNYTYRSPMSVYFKIGADYNFLYNSNPDYVFFARARYGFSPFSWHVDDVSLAPGYWDDGQHFDVPSVRSVAGWIEFGIGLRVRLGANISAGWAVTYRQLVHQSHSPNGQPWYIPGYGSRGQALGGAITISYTLPLNKDKIRLDDTLLPAPDEQPDTLIAAGDTIIGPGLTIE